MGVVGGSMFVAAVLDLVRQREKQNQRRNRCLVGAPERGSLPPLFSPT